MAMLEKGSLDKDLGIITPGSVAIEDVTDVKLEVPSLEKLKATHKETQKTQLHLNCNSDFQSHGSVFYCLFNDLAEAVG